MPVHTDRGWEIADQNGVLEAECDSAVYATRADCIQALEAAKSQKRERDYDYSYAHYADVMGFSE